MMVKRNKSSLLLIFILLTVTYSCREISVPKPKGHFRIDLPAKSYTQFDGNSVKNINMPFSFEYPSYGNLSFQTENNNKPGWFDIVFPKYRAKIYLTYKDVKSDFAGLMEQTYKMNVKNHIAKADAINELQFNNTEHRVFGILYDLKGNTASSVQFYITDSIRHYLRGSLYFSAEPDADSLAPVIEFFRKDMIHIIETLKWNN